MQKKTTTRPHHRPGKWKRFFFAGSVTEVVLWVFMFAGAARIGATSTELILALAFASALGVAVGMLAGLRLYPWMLMYIGGMLTGLWSAAPLYFGRFIETGMFPVGLATLVFFSMLGIIVGALGELIFYLHHLAHGRDGSEYALEKSVDGATMKAHKR